MDRGGPAIIPAIIEDRRSPMGGNDASRLRRWCFVRTALPGGGRTVECYGDEKDDAPRGDGMKEACGIVFRAASWPIRRKGWR